MADFLLGLQHITLNFFVCVDEFYHPTNFHAFRWKTRKVIQVWSMTGGNCQKRDQRKSKWPTFLSGLERGASDLLCAGYFHAFKWNPCKFIQVWNPSWPIKSSKMYIITIVTEQSFFIGGNKKVKIVNSIFFFFFKKSLLSNRFHNSVQLIKPLCSRPGNNH